MLEVSETWVHPKSSIKKDSPLLPSHFGVPPLIETPYVLNICPSQPLRDLGSSCRPVSSDRATCPRCSLGTGDVTESWNLKTVTSVVKTMVNIRININVNPICIKYNVQMYVHMYMHMYVYIYIYIFIYLRCRLILYRLL